MIKKLNENKILWLINSILSLIVALIGVFNPNVYNKVILQELIPGVLYQDVTTIIASIITLILTVRIKEEDSKLQIIILGILGYFFYAYGIYVIERVYTILYFAYMAILGLSFFSMVIFVASIRQEILKDIKQTKSIQYASVGYLLFVSAVFYLLWIIQLLPLILSGNRIDFYYSIYILDLCFVFPAFIIIAVMTAKNENLGLLLIPAPLVFGFTLLFPLALGEIFKPLLFNLPMDLGGMLLFLCVSSAFLILAIVYLQNLTLNPQ
ncbi:MAG: hypothetical protein ACFFAO_01320 [Candidatus Hermodarchaeota archaeon]